MSPVLPAALIEAAAASLASLEAIDKGAQQSVADTAAAYARVSADLLVGQARSGTDAGATLSDVAKGMVESAIRGAISLSQIDQSLQASIADLTKAVLANLELLQFQSAAADQSRTEGIEFRDRTFDFVAKKTIDTLVDQAQQEQLDKLQAALNVISLIANFVPILGQAVSAVIDLVNAAISVARGNYLDAGQYAFGAIPIIGDAAQAGRLGMTLQKGYAASNRLRQAHKLSSNFVTQTAVGMMPLGQEFATPYVISWLEEAPSNSFAAGTGVVTGIDEDGNFITTAIEDLRIGDVVLAGDEFNPNAPVKFALVTGTSYRTVYEQTTVTYVDADGNVEVIRTTGNHEFFVEGVGWKAAQHLTAGQQLILPDGETATVISVETEAIPDGIVVYNFSVTDGATYFVDDGQGDVSAVWVHNARFGRVFLKIFGEKNVSRLRLKNLRIQNFQGGVSEKLFAQRLLGNKTHIHVYRTGGRKQGDFLLVDTTRKKALVAELKVELEVVGETVKTGHKAQVSDEILTKLRSNGFKVDSALIRTTKEVLTDNLKSSQLFDKIAKKLIQVGTS